MKITAKQGKLLIISDLNITIMDNTVIELTDEEFNNSKDIQIFKDDILIVDEAKSKKTVAQKAKTVGDATPDVTNGGTVVTAGKTIDKTPENVFVANPAPTTEAPAQTKPVETAKPAEEAKAEEKPAETPKATEEQKVTASEAPATQSKGKRGRPSKK